MSGVTALGTTRIAPLPRQLLPALRVAVIVAAVAVAFWPTFVGLATGSVPGVTAGQGLLGMGLLVVGVLAGVNDHRPHGVDIHDREMDVIVGTLLLVLSLGFAWLLPSQMADLVPLWRPDLLAAATFLAGALCLMVGVRTAGRCWPAFLGLALVHPVVVELALAPAMRAFARLGAELATSLVGATSTTESTSGITIWLTDSGVFRGLELDQAVLSFSLLPLAAVALIATAVVLYGQYARRLLLPVLGVALLAALLTARIVVGVLLARSLDPGRCEWLLGAPGTILVIALAMAGTALIARSLRLTWRPDVTADSTGSRVPLPVATNILALGALAIAFLGVSSYPPPQTSYRVHASELQDLGGSGAGGLTAVSSSTSQSPYPFTLGSGSWTRTELASGSRLPAGAGSPVVLDVIDVPDASMLALYPPRELYGSMPHERILHRDVSLRPGLDAVATTYLGMNGTPLLSVLTWSWETSEGTVQQVSLLATGEQLAAVPAPQVDLGGSLLPNVLEALRGAEIAVPEAAQQQRQQAEDLLASRARQLLASMETS